MNEDQILDQPIQGAEESRKQVMANLANTGKRFAHYVIDIIIFYILIFVIGLGLGASGSSFLVESFGLWIYLVLILYYWVMESLTGKTVGKMITRTRIVKEDGSRPTPINVLGRTLSRLIPFEAFSFLGTPGKGWHDSIPKIYVIND